MWRRRPTRPTMARPTPIASVQNRPSPAPVKAREEPEVGLSGWALPGSEPPVDGEVTGLVVVETQGAVIVVVVDPGCDVVVEAGAVVDVVDDVLVVVVDGVVRVVVVVEVGAMVVLVVVDVGATVVEVDVEVEVDVVVVVGPDGFVVLVVDAGTDFVVGLTGRVVIGVPFVPPLRSFVALV